MTAAVLEVERAVRISKDGLYRYRLTQRWGPGKMLRFIMLNPSTADAFKDDNTIRRCRGFALREGYGALGVWNLWAYRTKDPQVLWQARRDGIDIVGPENDYRLTRILALAPYLPVVAAWGPNVVKDMPRVEWLRGLPGGDHLWHLGLSKDGHPRHPLMLRKDAPLTRWAA